MPNARFRGGIQGSEESVARIRADVEMVGDGDTDREGAAFCNGARGLGGRVTVQVCGKEKECKWRETGEDLDDTVSEEDNDFPEIA